MNDSGFSWQQILTNRSTLKAFAIACLCGLMWIPIQFIEDLIWERNERMQQMQAEMSQKWGGAVHLEGPFLLVPHSDRKIPYVFAPEHMEIEGKLDTLERYRGIFRYPTYEGSLDLQGSFVVDKSKAGLNWEQSFLVFLLDADDPSQAQITFETAQGPKIARANYPTHSLFNRKGTALTLPANLAAAATGDDFSFSARIATLGSLEFMFRPVAKNVEFQLSSNWQSPSFDGDRLPNQRQVSKSGFEAQWHYSVLGHSFPYLADALPLVRFPSVGLRLVHDVSLYQLITRSIKYALLIIVLTFAVFFLFEVVTGLHIHVIQYLFIGFALVLFYLLLLSSSEHLPFHWSYLIAAGSAIVMVTAYTRAILATTQHAISCGAGLSALYAIMYFILNEERYALLVGSWTLFVVLALLMYLTRKVKWLSIGT